MDDIEALGRVNPSGIEVGHGKRPKTKRDASKTRRIARTTSSKWIPKPQQAPRRRRIRRKSTSTITSANIWNEDEHTCGESQVLATILRVVEELRTNNGVPNKIANELRSNNEQLKASNIQLKGEVEELKTHTRHLAEELSAVKATLAQLAAAVQCSTPAVASAGSSTRGSTECSQEDAAPVALSPMPPCGSDGITLSKATIDQLQH
jgi:cell division protein FtsB